MVLGIADDEIFHTNTQIYQLDNAALAAARQQVQDMDADIREGGRIDVHCAVSGDNDLLALSFAYDDNWVVTVNGEGGAALGAVWRVTRRIAAPGRLHRYPALHPPRRGAGRCSQPGRIGRRPCLVVCRAEAQPKIPDPSAVFP